MSLSRQGSHYLAIGLVQWLVDWGVMVAVSYAGAPVEAAVSCTASVPTTCCARTCWRASSSMPGATPWGCPISNRRRLIIMIRAS